MENRKATLDKLRQEFKDYLGCTQRWRFYFSPDGCEGLVRISPSKYLEPNWNNSATLGNKVRDAAQTVEGVVDLQPEVPVEQIQIQFDRTAAARYGLTVGQLSEIIETA